MTATFVRLLRIADRLSQMAAGSPEADRVIHDACDRLGPVFAYSRNETACYCLGFIRLMVGKPSDFRPTFVRPMTGFHFVNGR